MRDKNFIAKHVGGHLSLENHRLLMQWAILIVEHAIEICKIRDIDPRVLHAMEVATAWSHGTASVGDARHAAISAHDAARECPDKALQSLYRACGHVAATAHMADHSLKARNYIMKLLYLLMNRENARNESTWQIENAHHNIIKLI